MIGKRNISKLIQMLCIMVIILATAGIAACNRGGGEVPDMDTARVERGDIKVSVAADGSIEMPRQAELRFGTTGAVAEVMVEEGNYVREGTLLARLDNTSQKNAVITALYDLQQSRNDLEASCSGGLQYIYTYPNTSALRIFEEAQRDLVESLNYLQQGYYKESASDLRMVQHELEICMELLETQLAAIETYPNVPATVTYEKKPDIPDKKQFFLKTGYTIEMMQQDNEKLSVVHELIGHGDYTKAVTELKAVQSQMITSYHGVGSTIGQISRFNVTYPDTVTSSAFLSSSQDSLVELMNRVEAGDYDAVEFAEALLMASLDLDISADILKTSTIIYESGLNLKEIEQYNLNLQATELDLKAAKDNLRKTEILAPFDSEVLDVGVEVDSVLSSVDYSAKTAVTLLDTSAVEFNGVVDEVDIFKVKMGQKVEITIDAMPEEQLTGIVKFISPFGTTEQRVVTFDVTAELDDTDMEFRGGLTATADIIIADRKDVLLLPSRAVVESPMGTIAIVIDPDTKEGRPRKITLGESDNQFTEVTSGLEEGEMVVLIDQEMIESGGGGPPRGPGPPPGRGPGGGVLR